MTPADGLTCGGGWCESHRNVCERYQPGTGAIFTDDRLCDRGPRLVFFLPKTPAKQPEPAHG